MRFPDRALARLAAEARACTRCADRLPCGPRPTFRASASARLLIIGQAPGTRVHGTGIPFNDPSGRRLRQWMGIGEEEFYDAARVAILPVGLCYPGTLPQGGDRPPMPGCAALWHPRFLPLLGELRLTLLVGGHAQDFVLGHGRMSARVRDFRRSLPHLLPLPHPSWRTLGWERRNPWFTEEVLPELRRRVREVLA